MFSTKVSLSKAQEHDTLYHHTNWTTLKYILQDKTLRLSRLDKVCNDDTEYTRLQGNWWMQYYVSCFTYEKEEDKYFWNEYGDKSKPHETIRIKFINTFMGFGTPYYFLDGVKFEIPYMGSLNWKEGRNRVTAESLALKQILYSDDLVKQFGAISYENDLYHGAENHAGLVKYEKWQHEKECRLHMKVFNMLPIHPYHDEDRLEHLENKHDIVIPVTKHKFGKQSINIPYIYLPLPDPLLQYIGVTFSYHMDESMKKKIVEVVENLGYSKNVEFSESRFSV